MRWQLSEAEKSKIRTCVQSIEYPSCEADRANGLVRLLGYLEGEKQIAHGVSKAYHLTLIPLLYSIIQTEDKGRTGQVRTALRILDNIAVDCSKKHVSFLLNADRFKLLVAMIANDDTESAMLTSKVLSTLLKIDDSIKELFWELNLHQVLRKALTVVLAQIKTIPHDTLSKNTALLMLTRALLDVLTQSTANVRHRQELYGSGYGLCNQLLHTVLSLSSSPYEGIQHIEEKLILTAAMLVRENKLNQDDFRKEPKQGYLRHILTTSYSAASAHPSLRHAIELLFLFLQHGNEGVRRMMGEEVPTFTLDEDMHSFMAVLLESLESLKRHHYDVDQVVRSIQTIEEGLTTPAEYHTAKCYYFRNCHGAWALLFLCLNNIDERIMYQACCLTAKLVRENPRNQDVLLEMDGIETLSEILSDYNLDIQLVGLQILDALKGDTANTKLIGDPCIVDYLLKIIQEFPSVFSQIVSNNKVPSVHASPCPLSSPSVTTSLNPNPTDAIADWEKQVSIVLYALALIGDIVVCCPEVQSRLLEKSEDPLLLLLASSYTHVHSFYTLVQDQGSEGKDNIRSLIRARTAPGRLTRAGIDADAAASVPAPPPLKKLSSSLVKTLLTVVEATCRALTNVVRHCPDAQWRFHKNGGTESCLNFVNCLVTFSEKGSSCCRSEHEAWRKVHSTPGDTLQDISYVGQGLAVLKSGGGDEGETSTQVGKSMYLCQNSWLVDPDLVASLLLLLVNTSEANRDIQSALCEPKVRLLMHYLTSHPSNVVINSALLLISHLCFNNASNQRFFATPYIVQRLQSLTAVSYIRLLQGDTQLQEGVDIPWTTTHLHLLTPPNNADPASFFAFQSLAYAFVCLANLLQIYPSAITVIVSARVHVNGTTVPWMKLLSQCLLVPCHPIQDAAMTLLSNIVNGCTEEQCEEIVEFQVVDSLTRLIVMDRSEDDTGTVPPPQDDGLGEGREAERKWLGNKAFQLVLNMGASSTKMLVQNLRVLVEAMAQHPDIVYKMPPPPPDSKHSVPEQCYEGYDEVDLYNAVVNSLPIINGLAYSSEVCRKACLDNGCWEVITSLACRVGVELDVMVCVMYIMSNLISHCASITPSHYAAILEQRTLDTVCRVILKHPFELDGEEGANMHTEYLASVMQLACQLVLRLGAHPIAGLPSRQFLTQDTSSSLLKLAEREALHPTTPSGQEALSFLLLLGEDDRVAETYLASPNVQELLLLCLADQALPQTTSMLLRKYMAQEQ
eukprot:Rhum_TRINITY_DN304_c0_g1::Rhum_TRINITY_DN304_c0_g1_i1::g.1070::m.1070